MALGHLPESRVHTERSLALLGFWVPTRSVRLWSSYVQQIIILTAHRLLPGRFVKRTAEERSICQQAAAAYERIGQICYYALDPAVAVNAAFRALSCAEAAGPSPELTRSYATMSVAASVIPLHRIAESYSRLALQTSEGSSDGQARAWALQLVGIVHSGEGRWAQAHHNLATAVQLSHRTGNWRRWQESMAHMSMVDYQQGNFSKAARKAEQVWSSGLQRNNKQAQLWGLCRMVTSLLRLDRTDGAVGLMEKLSSLKGEADGRTERIFAFGVLALLQYQQRHYGASWQTATETLALMPRARPTANYILEGYAGATEACLGMWEKGSYGTIGERMNMNHQVRHLCAALHKFARVFPIGRPRAHIYQGRYNWLSGYHASARKDWRKGLAAALKLGMPYEEGLAHCEIGRHIPVGMADREMHLRCACEIFERLSATYDLERAQTELAASYTPECNDR